MDREKSNNFSGVHKGKLSEQSKNITLKVNSELYDKYRAIMIINDFANEKKLLELKDKLIGEKPKSFILEGVQNDKNQ